MKTESSVSMHEESMTSGDKVTRNATVVPLLMEGETGNSPRRVTFQDLDEAVGRKLDDFDYKNPLGLSSCVETILAFVLPYMIITGAILIIYSIWTLKSPFLKDLVVQPALVLLFQLHLLLMLVGPGYVLMVQFFHIYILHDQIYSCFILTWIHNFTMLSTAVVLLSIIIERSLSIGRPELVWNLWRQATSNIGRLIVWSTLMLSSAGFLNAHLQAVSKERTHPICMPWWENDYLDTLWYKVMALISTLGPSLLLLPVLAFLVVSTAKFDLTIKTWAETQSTYRARLMELKANVHMKFVDSAKALGILFPLFALPVGGLIILGPAILLETNRQRFAVPVNVTFDGITASSGQRYQYNMSQDNNHNNNNDEVAEEAVPSLLQYSYILVSRTDIEVIIWMLYYTFGFIIVPVLLYTEVLFRREWKGRMRQLAAVLCCRKTEMPGWPNLDHLIEQSHVDSMVGPYVAKDDPRFSKHEGNGHNSLKTEREAARNVIIYDAQKAMRAGRTLDKFHGANVKIQNTNTAVDAQHHAPPQGEPIFTISRNRQHQQPLPQPTPSTNDVSGRPSTTSARILPGSRQVLPVSPTLVLLTGKSPPEPRKQQLRTGKDTAEPEVRRALERDRILFGKDLLSTAGNDKHLSSGKEIPVSENGGSKQTRDQTDTVKRNGHAPTDEGIAAPRVEKKAETAANPAAWKPTSALGALRGEHDKDTPRHVRTGKREDKRTGAAHFYGELESDMGFKTDGAILNDLLFPRIKWQSSKENKSP